MRCTSAGEALNPEVSRQFTRGRPGWRLGEGYRPDRDAPCSIAHFTGWPGDAAAPWAVASPYYNVTLQNADGTPAARGRGRRGRRASRRRTAAALPACSAAILADPERDAQAWRGGVLPHRRRRLADSGRFLLVTWADLTTSSRSRRLPRRAGGDRKRPHGAPGRAGVQPSPACPIPMRGQAVQAAVVLTSRSGRRADAGTRRSRNSATRRLAALQMAAAWWSSWSALPKTISGKIRRHTLRVP